MLSVSWLSFIKLDFVKISIAVHIKLIHGFEKVLPIPSKKHIGHSQQKTPKQMHSSDQSCYQ